MTNRLRVSAKPGILRQPQPESHAARVFNETTFVSSGCGCSDYVALSLGQFVKLHTCIGLPHPRSSNTCAACTRVRRSPNDLTSASIAAAVCWPGECVDLS